MIEQLAKTNIGCDTLDSKGLAILYKYANGYDFDERKPDDDLYEWALPRSVEFKLDKTIVEGVKSQTKIISDYPLSASNAWGAELFNIPDTKVVVNIYPVNMKKVERQIDNAMMDINSELDKTDRLSEIVKGQAHQETLTESVLQMQRNNDVILKVSTYVTTYERKEDSLEKSNREIEKLGFKLNKLSAQSQNAFVASSIGMSEPIKSHYFDVPSTTLAACFPFINAKMLETKGILLGVDDNGVPLIFDMWKREDGRDNHNVAIFGKSGSGKSFLLKLFLTQQASKGARIYLIDPQSEYEKIVLFLGGKIVDMSIGRNKINPFEITMMGENGELLLTEHLQFLEKLFAVIFAGLQGEALQLLHNVVAALYVEKGISDETEYSKMRANDYFTFSDIFIKCSELKLSDAELKDMYASILVYLRKCVNGRYAELWNGISTVDIDGAFIVYDLQKLISGSNKTLATAQMMLIARYLNKHVIENYQAIKKGENPSPVINIIDENHNFITPEMWVALEFEKGLAKQCRKSLASLVTATQSVADYTSNEEVKTASTALIGESDYHILMRGNAGHLSSIKELYKNIDINDFEIDEVKHAVQGTGLLIAGSYNRRKLTVVAPQELSKKYEY